MELKKVPAGRTTLKRLTRLESKAVTRSRLLASAMEVVSRVGYEITTVERIAEEAGYSKGAFYSNFDSKEEIFLELLETHAMQDISEIGNLLDGVEDPLAIIRITGEWVDSMVNSPNWCILALELFRNSKPTQTDHRRHAKLFHQQWLSLGKMLLKIFPKGKAPVEPEALGGLVFELAYASSSRFISGPSAGDMIRIALTAMYDAYGKK